MQNKLIEITNLTVNLESQKVLDEVSAEVHENEWLMVIGPNGAGKSTLVRALANTIEYEGTVIVNNHNTKEYSAIQYAKILGFLSQNNSVGFDFTVKEIIEMGRYCHQKNSIGMNRALSQDDKQIIQNAVDNCGLSDIVNKQVSKISGGELQRTFLAQVLTQDPKILVLDEPSNHLDLKFQEEIFNIVDEWRKQPGRAVVSVIHDLSLAKKYATKTLLLVGGKQIGFGLPDTVMCKDNLERAYDFNVESYMNDLLSVWQ